jgi:probable rRNA maturation factor
MEFELANHQRAHFLDLPRLEAAVTAALPLVLPHEGPEGSSLVNCELVEISFLDDARITQVHADFLNDPTPTDVITFLHGEILISTETAFRQGAEHGHPLQRELALYMIHGLLHLHGHDDHSPEEAAVMRELQEEILQQVWPEV